VTSDPSLARYARLVELGEAQCGCIAAGHLEELQDVQFEWAAVAALLPQTPPPAAEPLLRRALALSQQAERAAREAQARIGRELSGVDHSRRAGRAYRPADAGPPAHRVDAAA